MIAASRETFNKYDLNDRVKLIEGPAGESLKKLTGQFDLIFVDANKEGYEGYVKHILDHKLLSPGGLIMCDNGKLPPFHPPHITGLILSPPKE
jgi:predicted O-methyltransferase YrrM